jgi:hypothetical protein
MAWPLPSEANAQARCSQHEGDRFARAAEDVAAAERAIQEEIDSKETTCSKAGERSKGNAGWRASLSGASITEAA